MSGITQPAPIDGPPTGASFVHKTCSCCGLLHRVPDTLHGSVARCTRCRTPFHDVRRSIRCNSRAAAIATAALVLYPFGVGMPMLRVEQYGHRQETSVLEGVASLFAHGDYLVGFVVMVCSVVLPLGKLLAIFILSSGGLMLHQHHRALTYRLVEWTGRWGMLDILVVAVLVAVLKLGDMVEVSPGPGALAFASVVVLSLVATAVFDPHNLWEDDR